MSGLSAEDKEVIRDAMGHLSSACEDWECVTCERTCAAVEQIVARHVAAALNAAADEIAAVDPIEWALAGQSAGTAMTAVLRHRADQASP